jgi:aspartyl-tRNA(Asn)/glutamyl-tRNA(Gln) amidotransferase subunit A
MHQLSLSEIDRGLREKQFSSEEITQHFLHRINRFDHNYNAYITVTEELALTQAKQADKLLAQGNAPTLCGVPLAHKDIFCTRGVLTSCGSKMLNNFVPPYNATVVEKLNARGMVTLGKTNMDEFAMGSSTESSFYGPVRNPWDLERVPGGSSGGSAAAVAAQLTPAATATDTGGSIRQPASLCGLTGLKPTYGRVSRWGMIAFASSLDQGGVLTRSAEDAALLLEAMAGFDEKDSTNMDRPVPNYQQTLNNKIDSVKLGVPKEYFAAGLNSTIEKNVTDAIKVLESLGATIVEISLPRAHLAVPTYYVIAPAECSANLSRFDGVRYGHRCDNPANLQDLYMRSRSEGFGDEVKRRILIGTYALSAGYYDAYYRKAQQIRQLIKQDFVNAFQQVDAIVGPTTPTPAFTLGAIKDPVTMYMEDIFTISVNLAGLPGISIPCGLADNLPVGMQLIGNYFDEARILNLAHQFQTATDYHRQIPPAPGGQH